MQLASACRAQIDLTENRCTEALGRTCPMCRGKGRISAQLRISDFREERLPRLGAARALRLREVVRLGRRLCATDLTLAKAGGVLAFRLLRREELLLSGRVGDEARLEA
jgi:hypothetical protein